MALPGWTVLHADTNYGSPRDILANLNRLLTLDRPVVEEGEVLIDSVYRFKGRCAPCVVLTELDFEGLGEIETRKLFVGATRATMKLTVVGSERAMAALIERLDDPG